MKIVAYTFRAETYCPDCIINAMILAGFEIPAAKNMQTEDILAFIADANGIDRMDEHSFDSGEFPKVVFSNQIEDPELCDSCAVEL